MNASLKPGQTLANYQEAKVRWLHHKLTEWVELPAAKQGDR